MNHKQNLLSHSVICVCLMFMMLMVFVIANADATEVDERIDASGKWKYILKDGGATIMGYVEEPSGKLVIPNKLDGYAVTGIGDEAFAECKGLTGVIIPEGVAHIGNEAFSWCVRLTEVTIPEGVTYIGEQAFDNSSLTDITIPHSVVSIGDYAFAMCDNLTITIPESVEYNESRVFWDCMNLTLDGIDKNPPEPIKSSIDTDMSTRVLEIHNEEKRISCWYVPWLDASEEWLYILNGEDAEIFSYWGTQFDDVVIPGELNRHALYDAYDGRDSMVNVTYIGSAAFLGHRKLTGVTIPDGVVRIGRIAFAYCSSLTRVTVPTSVESIGECAFDGCENLTLSVAKGSFAEQYAKENDIPYVYIE